MDDMLPVLQEIGLSKNESVVYLKLSEIGLSSAYRLAKESGLFKANTYDVLVKLVDKGLVSKNNLDGKALFEAMDPSYLINLLEAKKDRLSPMLTRIRLMQQMVKSESVVNIYKGSESIKSTFYHFLDFNEPFLTYGVPKKAFESVKYWIDNFHRERIRRKIRMFHIYNFEAAERVRLLNKMPYTPVRCLPEIYDSRVATNICGDEVVLIVFEPAIKVIQIKDQDVADAYKNYFRILWGKARKIKG